MRTIITLFICQILLFSCLSKPETQQKGEETAVKKSPNDQTTPLPANTEFTDAGDSLRIPSFDIEVLLSAAAEKKMSADKETIIVWAYLFGESKDTADITLSESGELSLGSLEIELDKAGIARFDKINISKKSYESLAEKDFEILINIYSGRKSSQNNILDADILQEPISSVRGKRHTLNVKLIGE